MSELRAGFSSERFRADGVAPPLDTVRIYPTEGNIGNPTLRDRVDEDHFVVSETLSLSAGNHGIKTGFSFLRIGSDSELVRFSDGLLQFAPGENAAPNPLLAECCGDGRRGRGSREARLTSSSSFRTTGSSHLFST